MRPTSDCPSPRSRRKSSITDSDGYPAHGPPTTFFLASESEMQKAMSGQPDRPAKDESRISDKDTASSFGVQSIADALIEAFGDKGKGGQEEEPEEQGNDGIYRLFRRKRKASKSDPLPPKAEASESTKPQDDVGAAGIRNVSPALNASPSKANQQPQALASQPLTPLMMDNHTPFDSALPSTPKSGSLRSLRLSDEDDGLTEDNASQAIAPSDDDDVEEQDQQSTDMHKMSSSMPELVMPSLSMPSRRPFTTKGRTMGRLKVCVAGARGVGKSSLIRAIVQQCEDIVHVDPVFSSAPKLSTSQQSKSKHKGRIGEAIGTPGLVEIQASTKSYPTWWSDIEESRILRRRKSMEDAVLERNICFIDSPSLPANASTSAVHPLTQYMEALLHKNASISAMNDNDLLNVLSGAGGVQIDVVLYAFASPSTLSRDIDLCRHIAVFSNIIPLIAKSDTMSPEDLLAFKISLLKELQSASIKPFLFGTSLGEAISKLTEPSTQATAPETEPPVVSQVQLPAASTETPTTPCGSDVKESTLPPFAVSAAPGSDDSEMDASLLMSPSYNPPLLPSELGSLISLLFDPENMQWLRHSAVRKFITWRNERLAVTGIPGGGDSPHMHGGAPGITRALALQRQATAGSSSTAASPTRGSPAGSQMLVSSSRTLNTTTTTPFSPFNLSSAAIGAGLSDFTRARLRDHTLKEERLAQLQLQTWAADLQRNLTLEKRRYSDLAQGERAKWLLDRIGEEVRAGTVGVLDGSSLSTAVSKRRSVGDVAPWARTVAASARAERDLPRWARRHHRRRRSDLDLTDPLGVCAWQDSFYRGLSTSLRVIGNGMVVGAGLLAIAGAWYRVFGDGEAEFLALQHPEGSSWVNVGGQAPRWVGGLVARWLWGWGVEVRYV